MKYVLGSIVDSSYRHSGQAQREPESSLLSRQRLTCLEEQSGFPLRLTIRRGDVFRGNDGFLDLTEQ